MGHFTDRASWLVLALRAHFWRVTGTIVGTVDPTGIRFAVPELTVTYPGGFDPTLVDG